MNRYILYGTRNIKMFTHLKLNGSSNEQPREKREHTFLQCTKLRTYTNVIRICVSGISTFQREISLDGEKKNK